MIFGAQMMGEAKAKQSEEQSVNTFPTPGPMEGVKSRSKVVLRMNNVTYQYPTKDKPTISGVAICNFLQLLHTQTTRITKFMEIQIIPPAP